MYTPYYFEGPSNMPLSTTGLYVKFRGLSTDTKPMDVLNGSCFYEMDTGDYYMFDEENTQWRKQ